MASTREHLYPMELVWTGNLGTGTSDYRSYSRNHEVCSPGKPPVAGSSDPLFRGDPRRYSPEELLVASLSACHMLWYLHLCADAGIVVTAYRDSAVGEMAEEAGGAGQFTRCTLRPEVTVADESRIEEAERLHHEAHERCFIARSVTFPVVAEPRILPVKTL
ncbi:MAG TPA: OsmC family protein [Bryobacteraceae bacterium]|nr:OsmC family protein [Bryobacteraceae bacterium]